MTGATFFVLVIGTIAVICVLARMKGK